MNCKNKDKEVSRSHIIIPVTPKQKEELRKAAYASAFKTVSSYCRNLLFDENDDIRKGV